MSPLDRAKVSAGLEACLRRLRDLQPRFAECAAHALGVFQEGPGDAVHSRHRHHILVVYFHKGRNNCLVTDSLAVAFPTATWHQREPVLD